MSKKRSYMDIKNILSEGIISTTLGKLYKVFVAKPALKKDKKFQSDLRDLNSSIEKLEKTFNDRMKATGSKDKVKLKKYKIKDFVKG